MHGQHETNVSFVIVRGIMPRSGTNFLGDVLHYHPDVAIWPRKFWEFTPIRFSPLLRKYLEAIQSSSHSSDFNPAEFAPHLGRAWLDFLNSGTEKKAPCILVKEPSVDHLDFQYELFPEARTLVVVRDGRDVIESGLKAGFLLGPRNLWNRHHWRRLIPGEEFRILCRRFQEAADRLQDFVSRRTDLFSSDRVRVVKYESIVEDQEAATRSLLGWLGLNAETFDWEGLRSMKVRGSSFLKNSQGQMDFGDGCAKPKDFRPVGRWSEWSQGKLRDFERIAGVGLRSLGYSVHS